jgi:SAM-dependent methyltransferase
VLTVRYERLGLRPGERLLDLGSGGGRHAFEAMRRGASVTALDADVAGLKDVAAMMTALEEEDPALTAAGGRGVSMAGDARVLPFSAGAFDRIIAAEVLEHIPEDRVVPRWWPELLMWAISDDYHNAPGGHIRIYRRSALLARLRAAGLDCYGWHHAHALHSPYWWLRSAVGVHDDSHPLVRAYHRLLVWDITAHTALTRIPDALLNPVMGKSLVVYVRKPQTGAAPV